MKILNYFLINQVKIVWFLPSSVLFYFSNDLVIKHEENVESLGEVAVA